MILRIGLIIIFATPFALIVVAHIWLLGGPLVVPLLSPLLVKPDDMPRDARASWDFKSGMNWQFCRNLHSGRLISGRRGLIIEHGHRCGSVVAYTYEPYPSLEHPGLRVAEDSSMSFAVPGSANFDFDQPCPYTFSPAYRARAHALLSEAARLSDLNSDQKAWLTKAKYRLETYSPDQLRQHSYSTETQTCDLPADVIKISVAHPESPQTGTALPAIN